MVCFRQNPEPSWQKFRDGSIILSRIRNTDNIIFLLSFLSLRTKIILKYWKYPYRIIKKNPAKVFSNCLRIISEQQKIGRNWILIGIRQTNRILTNPDSHHLSKVLRIWVRNFLAIFFRTLTYTVPGTLPIPTCMS